MTSFVSSLCGEENTNNWEMNMDCRFLDVNTNTSFSDSEPITQCQGLSLSLGTDLTQYTNLSFSSLLSSDIQRENTNTKYLSFNLSGKTRDSVENEDTNNFQNFINSNERCVLPSLQQSSEYAGIFCNSRYLKAAQDLLTEVVSVHKALKQYEKRQSRETIVKKYGIASQIQEPTANDPLDISPSERQNLQNKLTKLLAMLDEVDKWYKCYFHQMQALVSSFEMVVGPGSAQPYTTLARQTISRQFRSLRDAIKKQIQDYGNKLGNQDLNPQFHRLKYVDQQLRQRKALHQFGIMGQPWRPQRGLPETAVSVLRAWLFEHFLNPYPKESEKILLAKQAGLSRSQVANWFINARVRLWKPMIENIYKKEFGDSETVNISPPEYTREISGFEERKGDYEVNLMPDTVKDPCGAELSYEIGYFQDSDVSFPSTHYPSKKARTNGLGLLSDDNTMLALSLQNSEPNDDPMSSSIGLDKLDYYVTDMMNNQHKFVTPHMFSDFVA